MNLNINIVPIVNVTGNVKSILAVMAVIIYAQNVVPKMVAEFGYIFHRINGRIMLILYEKSFWTK